MTLNLATAKLHWREILIALLLLATLFAGRYVRNNAAELQTLRARVIATQTFEALQGKLAQVQAREDFLYPEIERRLKELAAAKTALAKRRLELDKRDRATLAAQFTPLTPDETSHTFTQDGYPNTVLPLPKGTP